MCTTTTKPHQPTTPIGARMEITLKPDQFLNQSSRFPAKHSASMEPIMIKLELTLDEVNAVMGALGNMPYVQVAALVDKIKSQAVPQLPVPAPQEVKTEV